MMKFFRKHTKHLLAFFMSLLLLVWLLGDIVRDWGHRGRGADVEWGQVYGKTIPVSDIQSVQRDTEILSALGLPWNQLAGRRREPLDVQEWYMLDAEARQRGIYIPQDDVEKMRGGPAGEAVQGVQKRYKVSIEEIDQALRSFLRVERAFITDLEAVKVSEADIQNYVRDTGERAKAKLAVLNASSFTDATYEPTEEQYKQQFEKYRDKDPGMGEERYGYRRPEEVQIEYIEVKADQLARNQKVDDEEAYEYWKKNLKATATQPGGQPTTSPARPYLTFSQEALQAARKKLQDEKGRKEALRIGTELAKALNTPWTTQPATQPHFRQPPAEALNHQRYPQILEAFRAKANGALSYQRTQLVDRQGLYKALGPAAGASALQGTQDMISVAQAAFMVQGLEGPPKGRASQDRWLHNLYETLAEPFVDYSGNVYVFRTVAVQPKRPAATLAEVKDKVRDDLRAQHAAEEAKRQAEQLAERARQVGLDEAVKQNPGLAAKLGQPPVKSPKPFAREDVSYGRPMPTRIQEVGYDPTGEFVQKVFSLASETTTQPATTQPTTAPSAKVAIYPIEKQGRWIVVQLQEILPVTRAEYDQDRKMAELMLTQERRMEFAASWFSPQNIRARVDWVSAHPDLDKKKMAEKEAEM